MAILSKGLSLGQFDVFRRMLQLVFSREDVGGFKLSFFSFLMAITHHTKWEQLKSFLFK